MQLTFVSDITVEPLLVSGSDLTICQSAWVSSTEERVDEATKERQGGLLNALMRQKHGSPFESGYMEFYIDAPRAVRDEHVRHRIGWSYSSSSLRYNHGEGPRLYVPPSHRPMKKAEGFKKMNPKYEPLSAEDYSLYVHYLQTGYKSTYKVYQMMQDIGFAGTEDTRWLTHDGKMTPYIARCNPRSLMAFLSLRTHDPEANHTSHPMWEIEQVALQMEAIFEEHFPLTYAAFNVYGREAP